MLTNLFAGSFLALGFLFAGVTPAAEMVSWMVTAKKRQLPGMRYRRRPETVSLLLPT